jgi:hypothetical protein
MVVLCGVLYVQYGLQGAVPAHSTCLVPRFALRMCAMLSLCNALRC